MKMQVTEQDLIVAVADADMREAILGVLSKIAGTDTRRINFDVRTHPEKDGGCRANAVTFLRPFLNRFRHSIVMFDRHGCGSTQSREEIQQVVEEDLARNGWKDRAKAIVIDPELEAWVWGDLRTTATHVGWSGDHAGLRRWLATQELWPQADGKPSEPKLAMHEAMRCSPLRRRPRRSPRVYGKIAESADMNHCRDAAFIELRSTLVRWFPLE